MHSNRVLAKKISMKNEIEFDDDISMNSEETENENASSLYNEDNAKKNDLDKEMKTFSNFKSYFKADYEEFRCKDYKRINFEDIRDHTIQFSYLRLIEFFIYHLFFMGILGPFSILIFCKKPGIILIKNLKFWICSFKSVINYIPFLSFAYVLYCYLTHENNSIYNLEIWSFIFGLFFRVFTISVKYASFPEDKIGYYKNQIVNKEDFFNELTIPSILTPNDKVIYSELLNSVTRADIDKSFFWVYFYIPPYKNIAKNLKSYEKNLEKYHHSKWLEFISILPDKCHIIINRNKRENKINNNNKDIESMPLSKSFKLKDREIYMKDKEDELKDENSNNNQVISHKEPKNSYYSEELQKKEIGEDFPRMRKTKKTNFLSFLEKKTTKANENENEDEVNEDYDEKRVQYYGVFIIFELIKNFQKRMNFNKISIAVKVISALRVSIFFFFRKKQKGNIIGNNISEIISIILLTINNFLFNVNIQQVCFTINQNLHLKSYLMKQCSYMISPQRNLEYKEKKLLPTLNIYCPYNLKGWSYIRKISLDYAKKFSNRLEIFLSFLIIYIFIAIILLALEIFDAISFDITTKVILFYDIFILTIILTLALIAGAFINDHFRLTFITQ